MKILLCTVLAVIILPLIFACIQTRTYENKLQSNVVSQVTEIMADHDLSGVPFKVDHLDVHLISGIESGQLSKLTAVETEVESLGFGEVRAGKSGFQRKVFGDLNVARTGGSFSIDGKLNDFDSIKGNLSDSGLSFTKAAKLDQDNLYMDSSKATGPALKEWSQQFFKTTQGDCGFSLSAKDNTVKPYGTVGAGQDGELASLAKRLKLGYDGSGIKAGKPGPVELNFTNKGGSVKLTGTAPSSLNTGIFSADEVDLTENNSLQVAPAIGSPKFGNWVKAYFSEKGDKELTIRGKAVTLSGVGTPSLQRGWISQLKKLSLKPTSKLKLYPSEYHYPGYKTESNLTPEAAKPLLDAFALNQIFFDIGDSEVRDDQKPKIDALATTIKTVGSDVSFIIGGHTDSTGNVESNRELSKKRAQSVVSALTAKGISETQFTISYFGAAKSSDSGDNESDRKVELLIK